MLKGRPSPSHESRISSSHETRIPPQRQEVRTSTESRGAFLRFITADEREFGFPFSQLLQFTLEPHSDARTPQRLHLAFSSHDVIVSGLRLHLLCEQLDQGNSLRLRTEDTRFTDAETGRAFVADISISATRLS